ncbi:hypothetical protein BHE74_00004510 [Ensete ventricosum]|nr:hypothetical protein BHE74_00004510 [Ensete ventricosum]
MAKNLGKRIRWRMLSKSAMYCVSDLVAAPAPTAQESEQRPRVISATISWRRRRRRRRREREGKSSGHLAWERRMPGRSCAG